MRNPYNENLTYKIESDISEMIKLPQFVNMEGNGQTTINAIIEALVPNKSIGYLKLTDEFGRFFWYTMTIESYDDNVL